MKDIHAHTRGFTLIELIVVTGILALITSLILANNTKFGGETLLRNLAYDIALSVREAQVYGIAVRRFAEDDYGAGYGMFFSINSPTTYILYGDAYPPGGGNGLYDAGQNELIEATTMQNGFHIVDICATPDGITETCDVDTLDVLFKRPEPDAYISVDGVSGTINPSALYEQGRVLLESPRGDQISVVVEATGQISVQ